MTYPDRSNQSKLLVAFMVIFLVCFIGSALTLLGGHFDFSGDLTTNELVVLGIVVVFFVVSPLVGIVQVIRLSRKQASAMAPVEIVSAAPAGVVEQGYRQGAVREQNYKKLKSEANYWAYAVIGAIFGFVFVAVGLFTVFDGNVFFGIPFSLFGMGAWGLAVWSLLQIFIVGKTTVRASTTLPRLGESFMVLVSHSRRMRINELNVDLVIREHDYRGDGVSMKDAREFPSAELADVTVNPAEPLVRLKVTLPSPDTHPPVIKHVKYTWDIRVKMNLSGRPNRKQYFRFMKIS